jgi:hypothetical protein
VSLRLTVFAAVIQPKSSPMAVVAQFLRAATQATQRAAGGTDE